LSTRELQSITKDIIKCLKLLKSLGVIHCDLKPENILFRSETSKTVKVIDFGSATFIDDLDYDYLQTRPYRAPEISFGCKFDFTADIWSLGCILYELVSSRVLFNYTSVQENLAKAFAINRNYSVELFADGTKRKKYITPSGLLFAELSNQREWDIVIPKIDHEPFADLKAAGCEPCLISFIEKCLILDPMNRMTVDIAMDHEFLKKNFN
jgi:serine/threonine protein kinase